ncbi:hypothetical protein B0A48_12665 [Cryoendolithus antarcticus]|uniref:FHA domain-containing protein n=1 Tax=Cryoendolithus antarcticus TaxID=1507870 RepID=A0A1V8SRD8_9PEZI|nr:hypothetical protein B0A48_12665 [Cryoendolithus antarcticus]
MQTRLRDQCRVNRHELGAWSEVGSRNGILLSHPLNYDSRRRVKLQAKSKSPPAPRSRAALPSQNASFRGDTGPETNPDQPQIEKQKPNFKPTGLLAKEANTVIGTSTVLKYHEPAEARKPPTKEQWRMYVFRKKDLLDTVYLHQRSCWLVGQDQNVTDLALDHPSISKQHAVIQFRHRTSTNQYGDKSSKVKPYVIDLESANGTKLNGERVEASRYFELVDGDVVSFGDSEREKSNASSQPAPSNALVTFTDEVTPPSSTRPPSLNLPTRGDEAGPIYLFRIGRAYGGFYKAGLKAVWHNHKAASALKKRIFSDLKQQPRSRQWKSIREDAVSRGLVTRAEYQLLERNAFDVGKLPIFGVLVLIFGEWLPLLVPFMPGAVPATCRIPKQVKGMREKAETRRRVSFRHGVEAPEVEKLGMVEAGKESGEKSWPMTRAENIKKVLQKLRTDQLLHMSSSLDLHGSIWDRVQLPPPGVLLRRRLTDRLQSVTLDDQLLLRSGGGQKLSGEELVLACEERGIDVLHGKTDKLQEALKTWLQRQKEDSGRGRALMRMLFNRPNAWQ